MKEATWTAAERKLWPWRLLSALRRRPAGFSDPDDSRLKPAVLLVGSFADLSALTRARRAFAAAAFAAADVVCIPNGDAEPVQELWGELSRPIFRALGFHATERQVGAIDAPEDARISMRQVLLSGGGLVLVRSADRFPRACEIIHATGGCVGFRVRLSNR